MKGFCFKKKDSVLSVGDSFSLEVSGTWLTAVSS